MKRILLRALIVGMLWVLLPMIALASDVRDFTTQQELEQWLEEDSQNGTVLRLVNGAILIPAFRNNACVAKANAMVERLERAGFPAEQYTITSVYYFYERYPLNWNYQYPGHAVVRVKAGNKYYLIEPLYWMAWEFDEARGHVGKVSDWR